MAYNHRESETMTEITTKAFMYSEDGPGLYSIIVQKIEVEGNRAFTRQGYRGEFTMFMYLGSTGIMEGGHEPRKVANKIEADGDDSLKKLLIVLKRSGGAFDELEDGSRVSSNRADRIAAEYGVW